MSEVSGASWWQSLPGMLTALGAFLTAVTGLVLALNQIGFFSGNRVPSPNVDRPAVEIARDGPKQGPSFDCKTNKSPVEQAICGDDGNWRFQRDLKTYYVDQELP